MPKPFPKEFRDDVGRVEDGEQPGVTRAESDEVRELSKRNHLLEQENEVLRGAAAYFAQAHLPGKGTARS
ncbi:hypothetical protein [Citricoccus sp. NR2]|uniref:hypothetical protein n=1 Tax=Citricoccus sp. NR2 TaxID=3004095 RepID=UPI0022DE4E4B|nr:hypothetical protein [Citricoccus sp. NR2]WBL18442.1 hypothetical protein O1A05_11815 [Citricoccus sp. NR2]